MINFHIPNIENMRFTKEQEKRHKELISAISTAITLSKKEIGEIILPLVTFSMYIALNPPPFLNDLTDEEKMTFAHVGTDDLLKSLIKELHPEIEFPNFPSFADSIIVVAQYPNKLQWSLPNCSIFIKVIMYPPLIEYKIFPLF